MGQPVEEIALIVAVDYTYEHGPREEYEGQIR